MPKLDLSNVEKLIARLRERNRREASHRNSAYDRFGMDNTPENVDADVWQAADTLEQQAAEVLRLSKALEVCQAKNRAYIKARLTPDYERRATLSEKQP